MFIWDFVADTVLGQIVDWIYGQIIGFLGNFFSAMGNMGAELFEMAWVQSIVQFFFQFGWALYGVGLVVAVFECGIEYQSGRGSVKDTALNAVKGFMAVGLFSVVPVRLYQLCVSLQASFTAGITGFGTDVGTLANLARSSLKEKAAERMCLLTEEMMQGVCKNPVIGEKLQLLSERLKNTRGKKVYGYLKADVKRLVDQIVDELAKESTVAEAYRAWGEWQDQILLTYCSKAPSLPPLSSQKQLKGIKNMVIAEALKLGGHHFLHETSMQKAGHTGIRLDELEETIPDEREEGATAFADMEDRTIVTNAEASLPEPEMPFYEEGENGSAKAEWNKRYKLARSYLYGSERILQDFAEAMGLFSLEADSGNALAMYDLGRMWADGLGVEADPDTAQEWYRKALAAFLSAEKELPERKKTYLQYRIGKMYLTGLGCTQDYKTAADWLERAAGKQHKYAQYSLASLYARGQGVEKDPEHAFTLYRASATQENPYASYELGKMFQNGTGTEKSAAQADVHFQNAFSGFLALEKQSHDDKLQYRLGQMLHHGIGAEKDEEEAVRYWQLAAKLGRVCGRTGTDCLLFLFRCDKRNIPEAAAENRRRPAGTGSGRTLFGRYVRGF